MMGEILVNVKEYINSTTPVVEVSFQLYDRDWCELLMSPQVKNVINRKELKSIFIDTETRVYELNGEPMSGVSRLELEFESGKWQLLITKEEIYESPHGAV
ncbi:hypothetical protein OBO34_21130 [Clostridiales Family XIII bacterium ASD5510]|uniref:Uncharacterized protein n=1 Tax=Hominibacterium faecale TaxID=2839743 RepID=A0A9J6QZG3_9FIRM|nr:hypothetical protein [Hominibacterium faecale]MCU7380821.1 hypothetical protein [Hominibacterium faecale]